ncbi:MAG TPA: 2-phospho-L-lactate guanylyltransferase [Candidatus Dormibacteraeota bacterium]|jgi:2-phospho-L-lactate guanylyltransferase
MRLAIVVPIKSPRRAKHRLESIMSPDERALLAITMAREVMAVVSQFTEFGRFAVSDDPEVLAVAAEFGLEPLDDRRVQGQSAAVQQGFNAAWDRGYTAALTIPGDVPAVTAAEIRALCEYRPELEVLLARDREKVGTNGLRLIPPHAIALRFGEDSYNLHRAEAARVNRSFGLLDSEALGCDLDRPDDVMAFQRLGRDTATLRLLNRFQVFDRVAAVVTPPV